MNNKPIIGIIGKAIPYDEQYLWHQITCYDEIRYLIVKNGGIAIEILPTQPILDFVDVESDYTNLKEKDILSKEELEDLDRQIKLCDGFILQGGLYSLKYEVEIAKKALELNKPIIGICAGFNNILRAIGTDVVLDETKSHDFFDKNYRHKVKLEKDNMLYNLIKKEEIEVNSIHSMIATKEKVEKYAIITSYSEDGLVESFELDNKKFVLGFKWHPELMIEEEYVNRIFKKFIYACEE